MRTHLTNLFLAIGIAGGSLSLILAAHLAPVVAAAPSGDDAEMVSIPAGPFTMGDDSGDFDTKPVQHLSLPAYAIDTYEVTNARYKRFIDASGHHVPWSDHPADGAYSWDWHKLIYPEGKANDPVVLVSWEDAKAFCTWAGKHLPTEAQWEKAARGTDGRAYPWGADWGDRKANTSEAGRHGTVPVGTFKADVSPFGVHDMAGNVSEWVAEWFAPYPGSPLISYTEKQKYRVLRGGSWDYAHSIASGFHRQYATPQSQMSAIGFRCAR